MNHKTMQLLVSSYIDGEIQEPDTSAVRSHLKECRECKRFVEQVKIMRKDLKDLGEANLSTTFAAHVTGIVHKREEKTMEWLGIEPLAQKTFLALSMIVVIAFVFSIFSKESESAAGDQFISTVSGESVATHVLLQQGELSKNDVLYAVVTK